MKKLSLQINIVLINKNIYNIVDLINLSRNYELKIYVFFYILKILVF